MMTGLRRWSWMAEYNRLTKSVAFICNATEQTFTANGLLPTVTLSSVCWKYGWTCVTNWFLCSSWLVEDLPWCWSVVLRRSWMMWPGQLVSVHKSVCVCIYLLNMFRVESTASGMMRMPDLNRDPPPPLLFNGVLSATLSFHVSDVSHSAISPVVLQVHRGGWWVVTSRVQRAKLWHSSLTINLTKMSLLNM